MKKYQIIISLTCLLVMACNNPKSSEQEISATNDSIQAQEEEELENFANTDNGAPGITDTWKDEPDPAEKDFFKRLKENEADVFALDSVPFYASAEGNYAEVSWLTSSEDLLGIDEMVKLLNPNSSFSKNELKLNTWTFESECEMENFPDGIYTQRPDNLEHLIQNATQPATNKDLNSRLGELVKWVEDSGNQVTVYYFKWTDQTEESSIIKIYTLNYSNKIKVFSVSSFICGE